MSDKTFNYIPIAEENVETVNCNYCDKSYKGKNCKSSLRKHIKAKHPNVDNGVPVASLNSNDKDLDKLRSKFKKMVMNNPSYDLKKKVATNQDLYLIDQMEKDEIQARMNDFQREYARKIDDKVSKTALDVTGIVLGGVMDIQNELREEFAKDELLQQSVNDVLSGEILCYIDPRLKVLALGGCDVGNAYIKAAPRRNAQRAQKKLEEEKKKELEVEEQEQQEELPVEELTVEI
jgi:hypothetical protein